MMQVLVFNGSGVSAASRDHALHNLRSFLSHRYDVQLITPKSLRDDPWPGVCSLLVFPGGRDLPYQFDLQGKANQRIKDFVKGGGKFLGFCAGAYYASTRVEFEIGSPLEVVGDRELAFFPGTCRGTVFPGFAYETEAGARQAEITLNRTAWRDHWSQSPESVSVWYNGGGAFIDADGFGPHVTTLARYEEVEGKPAAGVRCRVGEGVAVLWAVHPEHPTLLDPTSASPLDEFNNREGRRKGLLRATLAMLDLEVSDVPAPPPQLLPLFLASPDLSLVQTIAQSIASKAESPAVESATVRDRNDTFVLHPPASALQVALSIRSQPGSSDPEVLRLATKEIIACTTAIPTTLQTPLFDLTSYFDQLDAASSPSIPRFGRTLLYGESVTSTQTMLDKNDRFLSALPTGLACLASHQISGRGRGANSWVSPAGCLQFSLILRLPMSAARKIVFVQYLFGLAVVEAVRREPGYEGVAVKLKWPNDIYGDVGEKGRPELKKIGGILVNSSYAGEDFTLVVGCGVNTSNPRPTTSVNELVALYNYQHGTSLAPFTQERLLALVLARFDQMWNEFVESGFEPFMDSYLDRWIHSNQRVTIQATSQIVKIVGITPDHGLLRTIAMNLDRNGNEVFGGGASSRTFVDLQPDGNGFDMVQGLLVSR
ncbi:biotin---protein ligase, partial [Phenoliferia sp. Uapishka_3]